VDRGLRHAVRRKLLGRRDRHFLLHIVEKTTTDLPGGDAHQSLTGRGRGALDPQEVGVDLLKERRVCCTVRCVGAEFECATAWAGRRCELRLCEQACATDRDVAVGRIQTSSGWKTADFGGSATHCRPVFGWAVPSCGLQSGLLRSKCRLCSAGFSPLFPCSWPIF